MYKILVKAMYKITVLIKNMYKIPFSYMYKILASSKVIFSRVYKNLSLAKMCTKFLFITHFMYKNPDLGMYKNLGAIF